jgi:hypothetical protein
VPLALASAVFLGPSPLGLATVFCCLRFETSLFVASYDSQGHGGGIRPRLHMGASLSLCSTRDCRNLPSQIELRGLNSRHRVEGYSLQRERVFILR